MGIYNNVSVTFLQLLYFQERITQRKHACLVLSILAESRRTKNPNPPQVVMLSLHASFYVHPILKFSFFIPFSQPIINPKVNSVCEVGRKIPEASPHAASPCSVSLTLPNICCVLSGCLCLSTLGSLPEVPEDRMFHLYLELSPAD